jgi:hypothetical protein
MFVCRVITCARPVLMVAEDGDDVAPLELVEEWSRNCGVNLRLCETCLLELVTAEER